MNIVAFDGVRFNAVKIGINDVSDKKTVNMDSKFIFVCCQVGAERALKQDLANGAASARARHPNLAFAFSRPGFVTFKRLDDAPISNIDSPFARTYGFHLAQVKGSDDPVPELVNCLRRATLEARFQHLHVWARDRAVPGERGFEPHSTDESTSFGEQLRTALTTMDGIPINQRAKIGDRIADIIRLDEGHWFCGEHTAVSTVTSWPGGVPLLEIPDSIVSRAYLKMHEALLWSRLPIQAGDVCAELGSSPGGSCQALLERG